jgi:hypothetical protein
LIHKLSSCSEGGSVRALPHVPVCPDAAVFRGRQPIPKPAVLEHGSGRHYLRCCFDNPRPAYTYDLAMERHSIGTEVPIPADDLQWMNEELVKVGNIAKPIDLAKVLDPKPREDALKLIAQTH